MKRPCKPRTQPRASWQYKNPLVTRRCRGVSKFTDQLRNASRGRQLPKHERRWPEADPGLDPVNLALSPALESRSMMIWSMIIWSRRGLTSCKFTHQLRNRSSWSSAAQARKTMARGRSLLVVALCGAASSVETHGDRARETSRLAHGMDDDDDINCRTRDKEEVSSEKGHDDWRSWARTSCSRVCPRQQPPEESYSQGRGRGRGRAHGVGLG